MAVERRRRCGYRKVGGLYLVAPGLGEPCHRLPFGLHVCPTCGAGIKQCRGWTWVLPTIFAGPCREDTYVTQPAAPDHCRRCPVCSPALFEGQKLGLRWIGQRFYSSPSDFEREAQEQGISLRISAVPRGFVIGETWLLLAHAFAAPIELVEMCALGTVGYGPGIFHVFRPQAIEQIVRESDATPEKRAELEKRGITPIIVPDDDPDHQGTVYNDETTEREAAA